jgi:hypothetical protein
MLELRPRPRRAVHWVCLFLPNAQQLGLLSIERSGSIAEPAAAHPTAKRCGHVCANNADGLSIQYAIDSGRWRHRQLLQRNERCVHYNGGDYNSDSATSVCNWR